MAGKNLQEFERRLTKRDIPTGDVFAMVDATGKGWAFHPGMSVISPLTVDKRWTKARVIEMFNTSLNAQRAGLRYPQRSLANRRFDAVIRDVGGSGEPGRTCRSTPLAKGCARVNTAFGW